MFSSLPTLRRCGLGLLTAALLTPHTTMLFAEDTIPLQASVAVNLAKPTGRQVESALFGVAMPRSEQHIQDPDFFERIAALQIPFLSLSLGGFGSSVSGLDGEVSWDKIDSILAKLPSIHKGPLLVSLGGPKVAGRGGWFDIGNEAHRKYWAGIVGEVVKRFEKSGAHAEYWELWIEPDSSLTRVGSPDFENLWKFYIEAAKTIKEINPELKVGGPALAWPYPDTLGSYLDACGPYIDFVSYHQYGTGRLDTATSRFFSQIAPKFGTEARRVHKLMGEKLKGREIPLILTEYNMNYGWDPGEARQQTEVNAVFTTVALMEASAGGLDKATIWGAYGDSMFGLINPETGGVAPVAYTLRQLAAWAPGRSVAVSVEPMGEPADSSVRLPLRAYATLAEDGRATSIILANFGEEEVSAFISLQMPTQRAISKCELFEIGKNHPTGFSQDMPLVAQMMEVLVPPMSVVIQRFSFSDSVH